MIRVGRIAGAHGLRGAVRLRLDNPDSDSLARLSHVNVEVGGHSRVLKILDVGRAGAGMLRVALEGVDDVNAALALKGGIVMIAAADLPPAGPREFYYHDLIGCEVRLTDGRVLGTVTEVFSAGANDVMVVRGEGREVLVPVIEDVVKSMELAARRVVVQPVPGLLD
jgi:16S rRNA processing protein RimM